MKRKTIIQIVIALFLVGVAARFGWIAMTSVSSDDMAQSPDKRYVAKVSSKWRDDFWGRTPHEYHCVTIESAEGRSVRRIVTAEPWTSWPRECLIQWATDNSSVTFTFKTEELMKTRLIINISP
ncbi:MAG: hypothetical protein HZA89_04540 [Verrucomicrobia bacterium]|nr:hypothetical protein [Verrucomicrobiota bacterium]